MLFKNFNSKAWSKANFHKALFKAICSTTWVWYLHSNAHDYNSQLFSSQTLSKVFCSNIAHLSVVFFWLTGMHLHGAYFSTYHIWLKDPKYKLPKQARAKDSSLKRIVTATCSKQCLITVFLFLFLMPLCFSFC